MAIYTDLLVAHEHAELRIKVRVAIIVAAEMIRNLPTPTAGELAWARRAFNPSEAMVDEMLWAAIIQNRTLTLTQITTAGDSAVQDAIDDVVSLFITP